ncbi:MAG: twin-arginine translocase subunit TatC [Thermoplasmatales archaeon]|nr:twin-arginine translocase subunit TatC [Candidatus Thermoplasmatota archaeon]MDA8055186.1 twin-arginine translocase subunit TatC [Thermoplasmatales archaeon]
MSQDRGLLGGKLFEYLDELARRLRGTMILFIIVFFGIFLLGPVPFTFYGYSLFYPFPSFYNSFGVVLLKLMERGLVPPKMFLINISPFDIIVSVVYIALAVSISVIIPVLSFQLISFAKTALYPRERKMITFSIVPILVLFITGVVFAMKLIIPILFHVIYAFALDVGVIPTIGILQFVSIVVLITAGMGAVFETPIVVFSLSYIGVVPPSTWFKNWRYAIIGAFFIALLISPGATGGIMEVTIALIIIALYFSGALLARWVVNKKYQVREKTTAT